MRKFLFTGTFEAGKTTLISLFTQFPEIAVVNEVARDILSVRPDLASSPIFHDMNFMEQIRREEEASLKKPTVILCDRGVLDIIAYANILNHPVKQEWIDALQNRYHMILFLIRMIFMSKILVLKLINFEMR